MRLDRKRTYFIGYTIFIYQTIKTPDMVMGFCILIFLPLTKRRLTVSTIRPATLYGSALEAGLLSSNRFQPFSTVMIGILIDAPLSETP